MARRETPSGRGRREDRDLRRYVRAFFTNWSTSEASLGTKLWLTARNRARAFGPPFPGCCGHHGEPGC